MKQLDLLSKNLSNGYINFRKFFSDSFSLFGITFLVLITIFTLYQIGFERPLLEAKLITNDVERIYEILKDIDKTCSILAVKGKKTEVDFLTVGSFAGSEVGPLSLAHPSSWSGPYLRDNPTMYGLPYDIVLAKDGYFILPGSGVVLPNGVVIGKDFVPSHKSNIAPLLQKGGKLNFQGFALAKRLDFKIGDLEKPRKSKYKEIKSLEESIKEFSEAIPYTKNEGIGNL